MLLSSMVIILTSLATSTYGHGRLMDPPARNSMWRLGFPNPVNYNDNELYCGGRMTQWARNDGKCGVCGDPYHKPREHEAGGKYANGIITQDYVEGDVIKVSVLITANHQGYFEFRICPMENPKVEVTQECLDKHVLTLESGDGTQFQLDKGKSNYFFDYHLRLPPGLLCKHCVIQWKYRTGNTWDKDPSGEFCVGCGPQEEFYNCADVSIHENKQPSKYSKQHPKSETTQIESGIASGTENSKKKTANKQSNNVSNNPYLGTMVEAYKAKKGSGKAPVSYSPYRNSLSKGTASKKNENASRSNKFYSKQKKRGSSRPSNSPFSPPKEKQLKTIPRPTLQRRSMKPTKVPEERTTPLNKLRQARMGKYHNMPSVTHNKNNSYQSISKQTKNTNQFLSSISKSDANVPSILQGGEMKSVRNRWKEQRPRQMVSTKTQHNPNTNIPRNPFSPKQSLGHSIDPSLYKHYSEEKKTYVHKRLPYWLIQALRMRASYNNKMMSARPKNKASYQDKIQSGRPTFEARSKQREEDQFSRRDVLQTYHRPDGQIIEASKSRSIPQKTEYSKNRIGILNTSEEMESRSDESLIDTEFEEDSRLLTSSEEESLIRKIVKLILERRQSRGVSKSEKEKKSRSDTDSADSDRKLSANTSKRYGTRIISPLITHHSFGDRSPNFSAFSSNRRSPTQKISNYYKQQSKHDISSQRQVFNDPKIDWLTGNTPEIQSGIYRPASQNDIYAKGFGQSAPNHVPFINGRSFQRENYVSLDGDRSFSPTSNSPLRRMQRQPQYDQHQKNQILQQQNNLDKYLPNQYVQDPSLVWALEMQQQRQRYPFQNKKPSLICKGVIRLGGGMDQWCNDNCNANFCPASTCICKEEKPDLIPVISSYSSNSGRFINDANGDIPWLPFGHQNSFLDQTGERSRPYYSETSVYRGANQITGDQQRLGNVGYKIDNIPNDSVTNQRYSPVSQNNILPYYSNSARSVSSLLSHPFSSQSFSSRGLNQSLRRQDIGKALGPRQSSSEFSRNFADSNLDLVTNHRRKRTQGSGNRQGSNYYGPKPSARSRLVPVENYYLNSNMIYHRNRADQLSSYAAQDLNRPF